MDFYKHLNYTLGNEDWQVEEQALKIAPGDRAICVTASGDRALHLLMTDCAEILSVDMNPVQNYLLELKLAAVSHLDYEKYLAFLGGEKTRHREAIFKQNLKTHLSKQAAAYWQANQKKIARGILYQGRIEVLTYFSALLFACVRRKQIKELLAFEDLESQRAYVAREWNTKLIKRIFENIINPRFLKYILNDPGLNAYTDYAKRPGEYIYERMIRYLNTHLAKDSPLLQLVLTGRILPSAYFPYLTYEGWTRIRRDVSRLHFYTDNVIKFLNREPQYIDCFSLSDIASYMPQITFVSLLESIKHAAKPNARFCLREFISKRHIPPALQFTFKRNAALEHKLENEESNFVYRFMVGEIAH